MVFEELLMALYKFFVYSKINKLTKIVFKQFVNSSQQMVFVA